MRDRETQRSREGVRDWSDAAIEAGKRQEGSSLDLQREPGSAHTMTLDAWPPDYERIHFCCFTPPQFVVICDSSPRPPCHEGERGW